MESTCRGPPPPERGTATSRRLLPHDHRVKHAGGASATRGELVPESSRAITSLDRRRLTVTARINRSDRADADVRRRRVVGGRLCQPEAEQGQHDEREHYPPHNHDATPSRRQLVRRVTP